ncbi:LysR family transcriptional regulator [Leptolyngbya sp. 15MV]|nr:LysR family transcriptional regulator [Leptolyngbya sp. 15MV]
MAIALAVARHGSIRSAARELVLAASVVSRRLQSFEDGLGVSLFERRPSGVKLTEAGAEFLPEARRLLDAMRVITSRARDAGSAKIGRLAIGTYLSASKGLFRNALVRFMEQNRGVRIYAREGSRRALLLAVRRGEVDVAILVSPTDENGLEQMSLWKLDCMIAVPTSHALAQNESVQWSQLSEETFLITRQGAGPEVRAMVEALLPQGHSARFIEQDVGREAMVNLVGTGLGVAVLAESASGVTYPDVVFKPIGDADRPTRIEAAAYWDPKRDNPALRRFLALLRASQEPGSPGGGSG